MKSYQIMFNQELISYDVYFKNMKSIRIRVKEGRIQVSAPYYTPISFIEENLYKYQDKLLPQLKQYIPYAIYQNQGYVMIYEKKYTLSVRDVQIMKCKIHEDVLYVYHSRIQDCVEMYLKKILMDYLQEKIIEYLAYDFDLDMPLIEIKKYKGRWGSCFYKDNKVTFNLSLIHLPKDLIDYVIVHELAHFLQANHSHLFYQEIEKRMPDYKQRQKRLKEIHI